MLTQQYITFCTQGVFSRVLLLQQCKKIRHDLFVDLFDQCKSKEAPVVRILKVGNTATEAPVSVP